MRKFILTGLLIAALGMGSTAQGFLHNLAGEPKTVNEVSMPEGAWYFQLICEHEDAFLNIDRVRDGDKFKEVVYCGKENDARLFFTRTTNEYPTKEGEVTPRMFHIGITMGDEKYASNLVEYKGKITTNRELSEEQSAESNWFWYIVPVEGNSPYVTIQNRDTKKMLTLGALADGKYELNLSQPKTANNADQHWKLRLMAREIF